MTFNLEDFLFKVEIDYISYWQTGSYYICRPPVMDTDRDVVILVKDLEKAKEQLKSLGWELQSSEEYKELDNDF